MSADDAPLTRAYILHPEIGSAKGGRDTDLALAEARSLAAALPALDLVGAEVVRLARPAPGMLFGKGRIAELGERFRALEVALVLVDGPVTPVQQRNLEKAWDCKLLDRTGLILEIFADRARTREGVLQVELAALSYQRTRLVRAWTHLERQRGGLGFVGGPGETQIEADRRALDDQIGRIRKQLAKVVKTRALHRDARARVPYPIVALVGYTNAGKSTLFNRLTGAEVVARDMLFATLDPTMRRVRLPGGSDVILSDTVGFISDLPTQLVAAFRATLEEVLSADLILHIRDVSHPETDRQEADVEAILAELGVAGEVPQFRVLNKIDLLDADARAARQAEAARREDTFAVSAATGAGLGALLAAIDAAIAGERHRAVLRLGHDEGHKRAWAHDQGIVTSEEAGEDCVTLTVRWTARQKAAFARL